MTICKSSVLGCLVFLCGILISLSPAYAAQEDKVIICHKPPGNPGNAQTLTVGSSAVKAHLAHGDTLGVCLTSCTSAAQCNDSNLCTSDACTNGACTHTAVTCDDGNPCTVDSCSPTAGCTTTLVADGTACNDGQNCTTSDQCISGSCQGTPVVCTHDACHTSICATSTGSCVTSPISYDDHNNCTTDSCDAVSGVSHTPIANCCLTDSTCDDGNLCTTDSCNLANNTCINAPAVGQACSNGDLCSTNKVCTASGTCEGTAIVCNDNYPCTKDTCDPLSGLCLYQPDVSLAGVACDDGIACTSNDRCNSLAVCSGSDSCVAPVGCASSTCNLGTGSCDVIANNASCDDNIACTADSCDLTGGCLHDTYACECIANTSDVRCDDHNPCTNDVCGANYDCQHDITGTDGIACSDNNACTSPDTCATGVCVAGAAISCDDNNACTTDSCLAASGCQHDAIVCNDNNICTQDTCDTTSGCAYTALDPAHPTQCVVGDTTACADLTSDPNNCGTCGTVCQSGTCTAGVCGSAVQYKAFVSSTTHNGNLGGLTGADAICQGLASNAGLPGTFQAWLSTSTVDAKDRFPANVAYYRVDGALIANNIADLIDGSILVPINLTESGTLSNYLVWTGTASGVKSVLSSSSFCGDWTVSSISAGRTATGDITSTDDTWENYRNTTCPSSLSIYCFQSAP